MLPLSLPRLLSNLGLVAVLGCDGSAADRPQNSGTEGDGGTLPRPRADPCSGVDNACPRAERFCDDDELVACVADANGCLVVARIDCADVAGGLCDAAAAECVTEPACETLANACDVAGRHCEDTELVVCEKDGQGCLVASRTDCSQEGGVCDADGESCSGACGDTCDPEDAPPTCASDTSFTRCEMSADGCYQPVITNCAGDAICVEETGGSVACERPCSDSPACTQGAATAPKCVDNAIISCMDLDGDGCLDRLVTECGEGSCVADGELPVCIDGELTLGTAELFANLPETFSPLADGDEISIVQGFQGLPMVVMAFRTRGLFTVKVFVEISVTAAGVTARRDLFYPSLNEAEDGYQYRFDLLFPLESASLPEAGDPVTIGIRASDSQGVSEERSVTGVAVFGSL